MARPVPQITLRTANDFAFRAQCAATDALEVHGDCTAPRDVEIRGVESLALTKLRQDTWDYAPGYGLTPDTYFVPPKSRTVYVRVRCRKCPQCLDQKRRQWTARAIQEVRNASRTWFGTLTVGPDRRLWASAKADQLCRQRRAESLSSLTPIERTKAIAAQLQPEVTRWLKRVRKQSKARFRYLLVSEAHEDGFPHFHLLLHEMGQSITKRTLEAQWKYGFSNWRLVPAGDGKPAMYVCKYLSKSAQTRVRASRDYGSANPALITELATRTDCETQTNGKHGLSRETTNQHKRRSTF